MGVVKTAAHSRRVGEMLPLIPVAQIGVGVELQDRQRVMRRHERADSAGRQAVFPADGQGEFSGLHRLLANLERVTSADAVVVVAGMEGALASVIGGLTSTPVVAVPTSVGYGAGLDGVTALLAMHASCASGITVVGIDNGFGAACAIGRMCA